ncbi:RNF216 [Symbiodinium natans]|uniref:RNF216 protein n=1 Tax=Symbiodinium natans TaxID=878477 RepID=A0A812KZ37_9DINO|nr:RNF216 [Symbiodinium natans]
MTEFRRAPAATIRSAFEQAGTYSQARSILEASDEKESLKCSRPKKPAPPCEVPAMLQKEMDLGPDAVAIGEALRKRKQATLLLDPQNLRCEREMKRILSGEELFAPAFCCLACVPPASVICEHSEPVGLAGVKLMYQVAWTHLVVKGISQTLLYRRPFQGTVLQAVSRSGSCELWTYSPHCDFMVQMTDHNDGVVKCLDPECGKITCRWCMKPEHNPLKCDEVENDGETRIRTFLEEKMAEVALRRCPNKRCRKPYEREEGCNHIKCPCGTHSCYLCGAELDKKRPYDHYKDGHLGGGKNDTSSRCIVYGTPAWSEKTAKQKQQETEEALKQYLKENPELQDIVAGTSAAKKKRLKQLMQTTPERRNGKGSRHRSENSNLPDTATLRQGAGSERWECAIMSTITITIIIIITIIMITIIISIFIRTTMILMMIIIRNLCDV